MYNQNQMPKNLGQSNQSQNSQGVDIKASHENEINMRSENQYSHAYETETQKALEDLKNNPEQYGHEKYPTEGTESTVSSNPEAKNDCHPNRQICIPATVIAVLFVAVLLICVILLVKAGDNEGIGEETIEMTFICYQKDEVNNTCDNHTIYNRNASIDSVPKLYYKDKQDQKINELDSNRLNAILDHINFQKV